VGAQFKYASKDINRTAIDFKEVYKWIMSPLIARKLNVPANLDGAFLINVNFCKRDVSTTRTHPGEDAHLSEF
jgi:hypothetical protein